MFEAVTISLITAILIGIAVMYTQLALELQAVHEELEEIKKKRPTRLAPQLSARTNKHH